MHSGVAHSGGGGGGLCTLGVGECRHFQGLSRARGGGKKSVKSIPTFLILGCHILYTIAMRMAKRSQKVLQNYFMVKKGGQKLFSMQTMENGVD